MDSSFCFLLSVGSAAITDRGNGRSYHALGGKPVSPPVNALCGLAWLLELMCEAISRSKDLPRVFHKEP